MSDKDLFKPRFHLSDVTVHNKERLFKRFFAIDRYDVSYKKFSGGETKVLVREIFERDSDAVAVLMYDDATDEIAMIEQFRPGALKDPQSPWLIEIVAGIIDKGEKNEDAAVREVYEETGVKIDKNHMVELSSLYPSPGGISEMVTVYVARADLSHLGNHGGLESESEDIRVFKVPFELAYEQVKNGRIHNAVAMISIMAMKLEKNTILARIK